MRMKFLVEVDARPDVHPKFHAAKLEDLLKKVLGEFDVGISNDRVKVRPSQKEFNSKAMSRRPQSSA